MSINLRDFGKDLFGGSLAGTILYGGGGGVNPNTAGSSPAGGGQPPLGVPVTTAANKGGFLGTLKDFFNSITDKPSTNAGAAAGNAFYEKAKPFLVGGVIIGGGLLAWTLLRRK